LKHLINIHSSSNSVATIDFTTSLCLQVSMPPKGEGKGKGGKGKGKGGIADFSDMKKEMPSLPPAPAAEKVG